MPILTVNPYADATTHGGYPDRNYVNETTLYLGETGSGEILKTFFNFDLSSIPAGSVVINSAQLTLTKFDDSYGYNTAVPIRASLAAAAWSEGAITHNNAPGVIPGIYNEISVSGNSAGTCVWDVTELIRAIKQYQSQPWYGIRVEQSTTPSSTRKAFRSREYGTVAARPVLSVDYSILPGKGNTPRLSPSNYPESDMTISWDAVPYASNYLVDYSADGGEWTRLLGTSGTSEPINISGFGRGSVIAFSVIPYNASGYGARSDAAYAQRNRAPYRVSNAPTPNVSLIEPGTTIRLSFSNAGDPDGNLAGYEVAMQDNSGAWYGSPNIMGSNPSGSASYVDIGTSGWGRGGSWKFLVRGYDAYGVRGDWSPASALVKINSAPPQQSSITVTPSPFETTVTVSWPQASDPDGNFANYELQRRISNDGVTWGSWTTIATQTGTTKSDTPPVSDGGLVQYQVRAVDTLGQASAWTPSAQIRRDDGSGGKIKMSDGSWAKLDIIINGVKHEALIKGADGSWIPAEK